MIKKSLIQGLLTCIFLYLIIIFFQIQGIELVNPFIFTENGFIMFYIMVSVGVFMFMRI